MDTAEHNEISQKVKSFLFDLLMEHPRISAHDVLTLLQRSVPSNGATPVPRRVGRPRKQQAAVAPARVDAPASSTNLRTQEGRDAYDKAVLKTMKELGGKSLSAREIRKKVGGTPAQFRATIDRHIDEKHVTYEGERAGMKYSLK